MDKNIIVIGDTVNINNTNYLAVEKDWSNAYDKFIIEKSIHTINIYIDSILNYINCVVTVKDNQRIHDYDQISVINGDIMLTLKDTKTNRKIEEGARILIMGKAWEVMSFTRDKEGLINLYLRSTTFTDDDNKEKEIAEYWKYNKKHEYKLSVLPTSINLKVGENIVINPTLTDLGQVITDVTYRIENSTNIVTITDLTVNAIDKGNTTLKLVAMVNNIDVATYELNTTIEEAPPQKVYIIEGEDTIYKSYPEDAHFVVKDSEGIKATGNWTFTSNEPRVTIKVISNNEVELQVIGNGAIILSATNGTDIITKDVYCRMRL